MGNTNVNKMEDTNNNAMEIFSNEDFGQVRVVMIKEEPYFVGKDVAGILGYKDLGHSILDHVDEEDRVNSKTQGQNDPEFGQRGTWLINESGLYSLIISSKLPNAKKFKRWVTSEVLPSIRKHGMYAKDELLDNPDLLLDVITKLKTEREERLSLEKKNAEQKERIALLTPRAEYCDRVLLPSDVKNNYTKLLTITEIGKDLGMSARKLNNILHDLGIIYKQGKVWHFYSKYQHLVPEYADYHISEHGQTLKFTEKGRKWLIETLEDNGYSFSNDNI